MNRADSASDGKRRSNVGFALQILQRRLASSPAAIHRSLERRRKRLEERLREEEALRPFGVCGAPSARSAELTIPTRSTRPRATKPRPPRSKSSMRRRPPRTSIELHAEIDHPEGS